MIPNIKNGAFSDAANQIYLAARGDQESLAQLYEQSYHWVYRTARSMVRDEKEALDIVRSTYVEAFQSLDRLPQPEQFGAWVLQICLQHGRIYLAGRYPGLFSQEQPQCEQGTLFREPQLDNPPQVTLNRRETAGLIAEILAPLKQVQRLCLTMHCYGEMTVSEIASILECPEEKVQGHLSDAADKVQLQIRELERLGTELHDLEPMAFLLWLFKTDAAGIAPNVGVLKNVLQQCTMNPTIPIYGGMYSYQSQSYQQPDFPYEEPVSQPESVQEEPAGEADNFYEAPAAQPEIPYEAPAEPQTQGWQNPEAFIAPAANSAQETQGRKPRKAKAEKAADAEEDTGRKRMIIRISIIAVTVVLVAVWAILMVVWFGNRKKPAVQPEATEVSQQTEETAAPEKETVPAETSPKPVEQMVITPTGIGENEEQTVPAETEAERLEPADPSFRDAGQTEPAETEQPKETETAGEEGTLALPAETDSPEKQVQEMLSYYRRMMALDPQAVLDGKYQDMPYIPTLRTYFKSKIKTGVTAEEAVFAEDADFDAEVLYCTPDLDGDGRQELVIATVADYGNGKEAPRIEQVFCYDGSGVMAGIFMGEGYLLQDGTIWCMSGNSGTIEFVLHMEESQPKPAAADNSEAGSSYSEEAVSAHGGLYTTDQWKPIVQ